MEAAGVDSDITDAAAAGVGVDAWAGVAFSGGAPAGPRGHTQRPTSQIRSPLQSVSLVHPSARTSEASRPRVSTVMDDRMRDTEEIFIFTSGPCRESWENELDLGGASIC
jgi:hypothetical protein